MCKNICFVTKCLFMLLLLRAQFTLQDCPEEKSRKGIHVKWPSTPRASVVKSIPPCYHNMSTVVTRSCNGSHWMPSLEDLDACTTMVQYYEITSCPPGFHKISNDSQYCYGIESPSEWDYPCFKSGSGTVISKLKRNEMNSLLASLASNQSHSLFWLPATRQKVFNPVTWTTPGPDWNKEVTGGGILPMVASIFKNCLALDVAGKVVITRSCTNKFPSLCLYPNDLHFPSHCPDGYQAFRFMPDDNICLGIEYSDTEKGLTFAEFVKTKCKSPLGYNNNSELARFAFVQMAQKINQLENKWCWFNAIMTSNKSSVFATIVNKDGIYQSYDSGSRLTCMVCEADLIQKETDLTLEYNEEDSKMYLTIYYPSGLWKYNNNDTGIRCFSNAKGFSSSVRFKEVPSAEPFSKSDDVETIEQITYNIDLIGGRTAEYWCEGHTANLSLITTEKVVANPSGDEDHVFALRVKYYHNNIAFLNSNTTNFDPIIDSIGKVFCAKNVLLMDILQYDHELAELLLHVHIANKPNNSKSRKSTDLTEIYNNLVEKSEQNFEKLNLHLISLDNCLFCLPTTSEDIFTLEWEQTRLGDIAAPKQFCLQANGLPVKRRCVGSYLTGSYWGRVDGKCDQNYKPSNTTTYLYNFVRERVDPVNFLNQGLYYVLNDLNIIIPADIYYLSMSLHHVSNVIHTNNSYLDKDDLGNIAFAVDRLLLLDYNYLNLAQTLNSTNVILDSVTDIVEEYANAYKAQGRRLDKNHSYQLSIKPKFLVQISFPNLNDITGICLIRNSSSDEFTDMKIEPLYRNTSLDDLLNIDNLEIATWIPDRVINSLKPNCNESDYITADSDDFHIIIQIFHNDAVFQEMNNYRHKINSRIVEISIPTFKSDLLFPIYLIFKDQTFVNAKQRMCGYWDFQPTLKRNFNPGSWKRKGCYFVQHTNNLSVCQCYHLTHFAQLISYDGFGKHITDGKVAETHRRALNIITVIGSSLSLMGILGIWITALTFTSWRQKPGTKILLQLSTAVALPLIILIYFNLDNTIFVIVDDSLIVDEDKKIPCIILGAFLHYSILSGFVWMLITGALQFVRYVQVLGVSRPSRFIMKLSIIGWGSPLLPVICLLSVDTDSYIPSPQANGTTSGICYPTGIYLILSVLLPVSIIVVVNIILFTLIIIAISRGPDGKMRATDLDLVKAQLRLSTLLFFLLGLSWIFGIFSFSKNVWWSYLFCLTATIQGFVLFLYFVVCDPVTRGLWVALMKPQFQSSSPRDSISVSSSSTDLCKQNM
ncbi:hypothetical protein JYU34_003317 [Plutella xylostella]|uniref:Uncharacterized protein n=1 Tax=Plutella xylostella TaxID=51655 RepID=A0ABQ7QZQ9_PLUXY|nr:hypothetical protein JYU34_003317 [Plutella xylostella]